MTASTSVPTTIVSMCTTSSKKQKLTTTTAPHVYKVWPSSLTRAGHTEISVDDPNEPLFKFFNDVKLNKRYNMHMGRMEQVPCYLHPSSKFRHGADRCWCPVHQGQYGLKKQLEEVERTGVRRCDHADDPVDFVRVSDIPVLCLSEDPKDPDDYCELGIWIGLPPPINTHTPGTNFFPGIHVHARKEPGGKKVVDTNFPAVTVKDKTGRFLQLAGKGVTITSPAALEYLYWMENQCPIGSTELTRSPVELVAEVKCKHCGNVHEDIGDFFGGTNHKKHLCGKCGRAIIAKQPNIGNPMVAFRRKFQREVVGVSNSPEKATLHLSTETHTVMIWPSTPAIFWSRPEPEVWGIHVHAFDKDGMREIDDTFGEVWLDGKKLDRSQLFHDMIKETLWTSKVDAAERIAEELEDD